MIVYIIINIIITVSHKENKKVLQFATTVGLQLTQNFNSASTTERSEGSKNNGIQ